MPCYQVNLYSVEFKATNINILISALKSLQWDYDINDNIVYIGSSLRINLDTQKAETNNQDLVNRLKRQYSKESVKIAAKKKGWILQKKSENQYIAVKY